jgi:hypothetical protein
VPITAVSNVHPGVAASSHCGHYMPQPSHLAYEQPAVQPKKSLRKAAQAQRQHANMMQFHCFNSCSASSCITQQGLQQQPTSSAAYAAAKTRLPCQSQRISSAHHCCRVQHPPMRNPQQPTHHHHCLQEHA